MLIFTFVLSLSLQYSWSCDANIVYDECTDDRVFYADQIDFDLSLTTFDPSTTSTSSSSDDYTIPSGAVCVATGGYLLDHNVVTSDTEPVNIPRAVCITPPAEREEHMAVRLGLVCSGGMVEMTWNTSLTSFRHTAKITLHTTCLNSQRALHEVCVYMHPLYTASQISWYVCCAVSHHIICIQILLATIQNWTF